MKYISKLFFLFLSICKNFSIGVCENVLSGNASTQYANIASSSPEMNYGIEPWESTSGLVMADGSIMDYTSIKPGIYNDNNYKKKKRGEIQLPKYSVYDVTEEMLEEGIISHEDIEAEVAKVAEAEVDADAIALASGADVKSSYCKYNATGALIKEDSAPYCKLSETAQIKISAPVRSARFTRIGRFGGMYLYPEVSSCSDCSAVAVAESCMVSCRRARLRPILEIISTIHRRPRLQWIRPEFISDCDDEESEEILLASSHSPQYIRSYSPQYVVPRTTRYVEPSYSPSYRYIPSSQYYSSPKQRYSRTVHPSYRAVPVSRSYLYNVNY